MQTPGTFGATAGGRRRHRRAGLLGLAFLAGVIGACGELAGEHGEERAHEAAHAAQQVGAAPAKEEGCRGIDDHHPIALEWEGLLPGAPLRGRAAVLRLESRGEERITARMTARFFTDRGVRRMELGEAEIVPGRVARVAVPLEPPGIAPGQLEFAAQVAVDAELLQGGRRLAGEAAPPLFFHEDPRSREVLAYGEADLEGTFRGGDFRGLRAPGAERVAGIGRAMRAQAEDLTGDPQDGR
jgi:hypothetical protein